MPDEQPLWEIDVGKTEDHWLELRGTTRSWTAVAKWDGCVDLYVSDHPDDVDYLHICDLDAHIAMLQSLRDMAVKFFVGTQGEWPG